MHSIPIGVMCAGDIAMRSIGSVPPGERVFGCFESKTQHICNEPIPSYSHPVQPLKLANVDEFAVQPIYIPGLIRYMNSKTNKKPRNRLRERL